jgi:hypothetical protein
MYLFVVSRSTLKKRRAVVPRPHPVERSSNFRVNESKEQKHLNIPVRKVYHDAALATQSKGQGCIAYAQLTVIMGSSGTPEGEAAC